MDQSAELNKLCFAGNCLPSEQSEKNDSDNPIYKLIPNQFNTEILSYTENNQVIETFDLKLECGVDGHTEWLKCFEEQTKTHYTIRKSTPQGRRYSTTIYAVCHHNTYYNSSQSDKLGSKNTSCPSRLKIQVEKPFLKIPPKTLISVNFKHNHPLDAADVLRFRKPSDELKQKFKLMFEQGHTPATALHSHNLELILCHPDSYPVMLADASLSPNYQWAARLHRKLCEDGYGERSLSPKEQADLVSGFVADKGCNSKVVVVGDQVAIALTTPLMTRVAVTRHAGDVIFLDSTGGMDKDGTRVFIFMCSTAVGGLPIGVVFTTSETTPVLVAAFGALKDILPHEAFGGRSMLGPQAFMTDDCAAERQALITIWPDSRTFLCIFHVLQALWRWLFQSSHQILMSDRKILMLQFKQLLYAKSADDFNNLVTIFTECAVAKKYENFVHHVDQLLQRKEEWALFCRPQHVLKGNNTNNICESAMHIIKDYILERCKAYNMVQLADFMLTKLDLFYQQKLLNMAYNRLQSTALGVRYASIKRNVQFAEGKIIQLGENCFSVPSESKNDVTYSVDMSLCCWDCVVGLAGQLCKHQIAIYKYCNISNDKFIPVSDVTEKQNMYFLATGQIIQKSFFYSLRSEQAKENVASQATDNTQLNLQVATGMAAGDVNEEDEDVPAPESDVIPSLESAKEKLSQIFYSMQRKLEEKPDIYASAIINMAEKYEKLATDSNLVTAMCTFGNSQIGTNYSTGVLGMRRKGQKIKVQPTAIARRKMILGRGSSSAANHGRPRTYKHLRDHPYTMRHRKSKAGRSLSQAIENNSANGKTHSKK